MDEESKLLRVSYVSLTYSMIPNSFIVETYID